jgi:hypothetical protein
LRDHRGGYRLGVGFLLTVVLLVDSLWTILRAGGLRRTTAGSRSTTLLLESALFAAAAAYLTYYAASEDSYRRGGITRWEAYDAHSVTVGAILACVGVCALALLADRKRGRLASVAGLAGLISAIAFAAAIIANSNN